jgi:2-iminobutanoate/2-iminopropanoate deaminase
MVGKPNPVVPKGIAAPGGHYSHAVTCGGLVFVSGQLPIAPDGKKLASEPFAKQVTQALANVEAILDAAGASISTLVQIRVYIVDIELWPDFNEIYAQWCGHARPSRAVVPVPCLHYDCAVEIEAVAAIVA